jgi:archaemetzincin
MRPARRRDDSAGRGRVCGLLALAFALFSACGAPVPPPPPPAPPSPAPPPAVDVDSVRAAMEAVRPLHTPLGPPRPGDWLASFEEPGQTFEQYLTGDPRAPRGERRVVYIQPLGEFTPAQARVVGATADFMGRYFGIPVRTLGRLSLDLVPRSQRRINGTREQVCTGYVTQTILKPRLPADAAALIALTSSDLWPCNDWNYVFGQASLVDRVGVYSMARFGVPEGEAALRVVLLRTLKIATHETGHMFSIVHCAAYECNMGGTMTLEETDRHPLELCPECMAKVCWGAGYDPAERFARLAEFCRERGLERERGFYERSLAALRRRPGS